MIARFLLLLAFAIPIFAQTGLYGPITTHLKAGDPAPDITFTRLISAPVSSSWSQSNLTGQLTVLVFYPDTSDNPDSVTQWNALVEKFTGKPVQFLWVTGEKDATLLPFLSQNPIKGWVFNDLAGKTGNAYGLEVPSGVIIGTDRKIIGFDESISPSEQLVNAALEGRVTTKQQTMATVKDFIASNLVPLSAEPHRMPFADDHKPNFPPSDTVHISPSQGDSRGNFGSDTFRSLQGTSLKEAIQDVYGNINPIRIHLPAALDNNKHYDFSLVLPAPESREKMNERFQQGIQDYFHLTARRENRQQDVYVVTTVPNHHPPQVKPDPHPGPYTMASSSGIEYESTGGPDEPLSIDALRGIAIQGTADEFCHQLEFQLDRPVINETNLQGEYKFNIKPFYEKKNDFPERLRDQLGLIITPSQRVVEILVFEPR